jgi:hypothetical protein
MRYTQRTASWVVYSAPVYQKAGGMNAVCEQEVWDAMEKARPGFYTLIRGGIATEGEAEQLARGTSGDRPKPAR